MNNDLIKIQVSGVRYSENSIGALVDLNFNKNGDIGSASRLVWFPKLFCKIQEVTYNLEFFGKIIDGKKYFILAPKWFLEQHNIKYEI